MTKRVKTTDEVATLLNLPEKLLAKDTGEFSILGFFLFGNLVKCLLICELFLSHR